MVCYTTLAVTPERVPLGLLAQRNRVRDEATFGALSTPKKRAIKDKESSKWLESVAALAVAREAAPHTTFISVGDREAGEQLRYPHPAAVGVAGLPVEADADAAQAVGVDRAFIGGGAV